MYITVQLSSEAECACPTDLRFLGEGGKFLGQSGEVFGVVFRGGAGLIWKYALGLYEGSVAV